VALKPVSLVCLAVAALLAASTAHAEDSRLQKAREVRDELLQKRRSNSPGTAARPDAKPAARSDARSASEDPFQASIVAARERLAVIDTEIEEKRRQSEAVAAPRDKLQARSDELWKQVTALQEQNRSRVEAIYRSAKLGAGAAGWHPEPARSARLSRYLASIAAVQQKKLELVEIEHGSVIASLDKARADDASAAGALRALDTDRAEAEAGLERVLADAGTPRAPGLTPEEAEAEALAQEHMEAMAADRVAAPVAEASGPGSDSALAVERALALLKAKTAAKPAAEPGTKPGEEAEAGDFAWPAAPGSATGAAAKTEAEAAALASATGAAAKTEAEAAALASATGAAAKTEAETAALASAHAALEARAAEQLAADLAAEKQAETEGKAAEARVAAEAKAAGQAAERKAAEAKAAEEEEEEKEAEARDAEAKAAEEARAVAAKKATEDAHGTSGELEEGQAVLASSTPAPSIGEQVASVPAQPGGESAAEAKPAGNEDKPKRPNLLSRMFGSDRESDTFAASRGSLPPPVAGKVVANYGQQHKTGATYRGVILRAGHSAPIKAVAGGKVSFAGNVPGLGNTVIVSHGGRYHTVYARLGSLEVKEGQSVGGGTEIGTLPADDADMHFELRDQGKAVDPVPWLKGGIPGTAQ
jgi:murein DD-endopeptidase MepM/ murein hydrolase activator NlpD